MGLVIDGKPSRTAQFVAATRALGALLPDAAQLAVDPFGARVGGAGVATLAALARRAPSLRPLLRVVAAPMLPMIAYMQVRTRLIDDVVRAFVGAGGAQIVLLGAGFDARAARLADGGARFFEVDHPATQALKRERFGDLPVTFVPWNFERDAMATLGARLAAVGHDPARPTLTIWEGVTMYLTEPAIADTVAAVRGWSAAAAGSRLCFSYVDRRQIDRPRLAARLVKSAVRLWGEPWRFGWEPRELPGWLAAHGYRLLDDEDIDAAGHQLLPRRFAALLRKTGDRHIAVAAPDS